MSLGLHLFFFAAGIWLLAVVGLALFQRSLVYRPEDGAASPEEAGASWLREVREGRRVLGWWSPPASPGLPLLVVFYGNRGNLARMAAKTAAWHAWGFGLFLVAYRGYDGNPGSPSEAGLAEDGGHVLDWLVRQGYGKDETVLYGESLGSSPALRLAAQGRTRALVLEAPFSSLTELASERYPWAPVRLLLRQGHDNRPYLAGLTMPVLILHGDADRTTPVEHSRRLAALTGNNGRLAIIPGAGHLDLYDRGAGPILSEFLNGL